MQVKILGSGCTRCNTLEQTVRRLNSVHQLKLDIEKVTDLQEMIRFGILTTPGLVVDGVLKSTGTIPSDEQLLRWFKGQQP